MNRTSGKKALTLRRDVSSALSIVLVGGLLASPTLAATFHVQPSDSLAAALALLHHGDTLLLHAGVYRQTLDLAEGRYPALRGTSWAQVTTISAAPGEVAILRPGGAGSVVRIAPTASVPYRYIVLSRLVMDATGGGYGISWSREADHIRVQDGEIFGGRLSGISGMGPFGEVLRMKIHHSGDSRLSHGMYVCPAHAVIKDNELYSNSGYGLQLYAPPHPGCSTGTVIVGNHIHDNLGDAGVILSGGEGILFCGNRVVNNHGGGIKPICYGAPNRHIQILSNTVTGNSGPALAICPGVTDTLVQDNLFTGNQGDVLDEGTRTVQVGNGPQARGVSGARCGGSGPPPVAGGALPAPTNLRLIQGP